jgi:hypothetical protein
MPIINQPAIVAGWIVALTLAHPIQPENKEFQADQTGRRHPDQ